MYKAITKTGSVPIKTTNGLKTHPGSRGWELADSRCQRSVYELPRMQRVASGGQIGMGLSCS